MKSKPQKRREAIQRLRDATFVNSKQFRILANKGHNLDSPLMHAAEERWNDARLQEIAYLESLS